MSEVSTPTVPRLEHLSDDQLLTIEHAAQFIDASTDTVYRLLRSGRLKSKRARGRVRGLLRVRVGDLLRLFPETNYAPAKYRVKPGANLKRKAG